MRTGPRSGTVLMETVLCLPLLLMLITGIGLFARIWEARLFTRYAAYNAARAALVYNVNDYGTVTYEGGKTKVTFAQANGPVWLAAVNTLAWMSHSSDEANYALPGAGDKGEYPNSSAIRNQVRIDAGNSVEMDGYVKVTVEFDFPLIIPIYDAKALWGDNSDENLDLVFDPVASKPAHAADPGQTFTLTESCALPKPWSTMKYPRIPAGEPIPN